MFSRSLERTLKRDPDSRGVVQALTRALEEYQPGLAIRPSVLSRRLKIDPTLTVAVLHALQHEGVGRLGLRVLDPQGLEVQRFKSADELPAYVVDEMGDRIELTPENVEVYFERTPK
jgi:hypothetical protein